MAVDERKALDIIRFIPAHVARAVHRDARLDRRRRASSAHHTVARIAQATVPVVISMTVFVPLADDESVMNDRLMGVGDQTLVGGIKCGHVV